MNGISPRGRHSITKHTGDPKLSNQPPRIFNYRAAILGHFCNVVCGAKRLSVPVVAVFIMISLNIHCVGAFKTITSLIILCVKLSWFCHTNRGQLFCNGLLFVIALVPGLFFGGKARWDMLSFCCCFKMAENSVSFLCRTKYCNLNENRDY